MRVWLLDEFVYFSYYEKKTLLSCNFLQNMNVIKATGNDVGLFKLVVVMFW